MLALVHEHGKWLSGFLRGLVRSEVDAADAYQEVWKRVLKAGGVREDASPRAFLATIARSVIIDRYRRGKKYELTMDAPNAAEGAYCETLVDPAPTPAECLERKTTLEAVRQAIRALPDDLKQVVLLRVEAELTFQQIADELQLPLGTVLTRMRKATEILKKRLGGWK